MPHISDKKLNKNIAKQIDNQLLNILSSTKTEDLKFIMEYLLTPTERLMLAKRLAIFILLKDGLSGYKISKLLKISKTTVSKFAGNIDHKVNKRQENSKFKDFSDDLLDYVFGILSVPFDRPYKGVSYKRRK